MGKVFEAVSVEWEVVWNVNVREFRPENEFLEVFLGLHGSVFGCWNREDKKREKRKQEKKVEVWFEFGFLGLFSWIGFSFGLGVI